MKIEQKIYKKISSLSTPFSPCVNSTQRRPTHLAFHSLFYYFHQVAAWISHLLHFLRPGASISKFFCMNSQNLLHVPFEPGSDQGDVIRGDVRYCPERVASPQGHHQQSVFIVAHGFKAFKDWGPFPHIGERFAKAGFVSVVFNFSHNGVGPNPHRITAFQRFAKNTISREVDDLGRVLDALVEGSIPLPTGVGTDKNSIGIVGHSRGAGVAIIRARKDKRVRAVAAWSAVSTFDRWNRQQKEKWRDRGHLSVSGAGVKPKFRISADFLEDLEKNKEDLDILRAVSELHVPLLLVYGNQDLVTPVEEAENLYARSDRTKTDLILLERTGHMLGGGSNPFRGSSTLDRVIDLTSAWFHRNLESKREADGDFE